MLVRIIPDEDQNAAPILASIRAEDRYSRLPIEAFVLEDENSAEADAEGYVVIYPDHCAIETVTVH